MTEIELEIQSAVQDQLILNRGQQHAGVLVLEKWVRARAIVPDTDVRLWAMLKLLPAFVENLELKLASAGLEITLRARSPHNLQGVALILERGATWLQAGDWRPVVLAAVSKESPSSSS